MPYVQRDADNKIKGVYANEQPGYAEEFVGEDSADIYAYQYIAPLTYKELRAAEFNLKSPGEQFAMQYDDAVNKTTTWVDWQTEIKTRISKP